MQDMTMRDESMPTMKEQQRAYTRELAMLAIGGVVAGLAAAGLELMAGGSGAPLAVLSFGAIMGVMASFLDRGEGRSGIRVIMGVLGGLAMVLLLSVHPLFAALVGGVFIGASYSLEHSESKAQRAGIWLAYGASLAAATFTADTLLSVGFLQALKLPVFSHMITAGFGALFMMLPAGLKYIEWEGDPVSQQFRRARGDLGASQQQFLDDALETYERVLQEVEREGHKEVRERASAIAADVATALLALTRRADELQSTRERTEVRPLESRTRDLERRIRATRDVSLRKELMAALGEVAEQMKMRRRLEAACVRLETRQQRYLTALERLHVTLVHNDSLTTSGEGAISISLDDLQRLTEEVEWQNLSVEELCSDEEEPEEAQEDPELDALLANIQGLSSSLDDPMESHEVILDTSEPEEDVVLPQGTDGTVEAETSASEVESAEVEHAQEQHASHSS